MSKWIFCNWGSVDVGGGRWLVQKLDDEQQVIPFATERFSFRKAAMQRAQFLTESGSVNLQVLCEHAFCER